MDTVYFSKDFSALEAKTKNILKGVFAPGKEIMVKIHFGEPGNKAAFTPEDIEPLILALKSFSLKPVLMDTPVLYSSPRQTVEGYIEVVKEKGYDKISDFVISDTYKEVKTKDFTAEVAKELTEAENVLVISHVKGHGCSGFGGAIKNLGMGGVSPKTKNIEHNLSRPRLVGKCRACGVCVELCPEKAIKIENNTVVFDYDKCIGCSICQEKCPYKVLAPESVDFDDLLAQGAAAVVNNFPKNSFYINFIKNVVRNCDCASNSGPIISKDIGILFSSNPAAIDRASVELVREANKKEVFQETHHKDPLEHVELASKYIGCGTDYEIKEI